MPSFDLVALTIELLREGSDLNGRGNGEESDIRNFDNSLRLLHSLSRDIFTDPVEGFDFDLAVRNLITQKNLKLKKEMLPDNAEITVYNVVSIAACSSMTFESVIPVVPHVGIL